MRSYSIVVEVKGNFLWPFIASDWEEVLRFLGCAAYDEEERSIPRHLLGMASTIDSDPNKIENRLA